MKKTLFISFILSLGLHYSYAQEYKSTWESIDSRPIPEWFSEAKFGIFIHWGLYSVPAWAPTNGPVYEKYSEWYWARQNPSDKPFPAFTDFHNKMYGEKTGYTDFVSGFKAEMFDPAKWAEIFKQSGAKYIVLTSKHHDGFALWPSEQAWNWNSEEVGPHRDLAGDLSEAIKQSGMHMGFYYSLYEWYNPLYKKDLPKYVSDHMIPQMKDLVNRYQPDIVWTDGEWELTSDQWKSTDFLAWLYNESPVKNTVVVNDRWGKETRGKHGGIYTTEYDLVGDLAADRVKPGHPWEECRGIGGSFGYNRNENLENYETSESLIRILIDKVSMGGNLLLNVGPTADGRIPVIMQQRLKDIGDWLSVNGDAIYGTHAWKYTAKEKKKEQTIFFTAKGDDLYVIITRWQNQPIKIEGVSKTDAVNMLGFNRKINYTVSKNNITIHLPEVSPADNLSSYAWVFKVTGGAK
ncbi:alpha-L-fucosidase [Dysgonomonas capnocytophagoides]|uniref:alpha-L-fucosidase n=1 Tax=Dysgonomonas capnocytophagoides TaxID=45254 RepID=A0A4Y8L1Y3_9BACT|nr:alpha-L-fucosidase [Dysgonomonas capnocytophagoides]TFD94742.1 alpha-L-fucosidase [Dysgonomonas capnocytophagoides]